LNATEYTVLIPFFHLTENDSPSSSIKKGALGEVLAFMLSLFFCWIRLFLSLVLLFLLMLTIFFLS